MSTVRSLLTAAALVSALVTLAGTGSWRLAVRVLLDLLTAVGLLRLVGTPALSDLAAVVAVVALRIGLSVTLGVSGGPAGSGGQRRWCQPGRCRE